MKMWKDKNLLKFALLLLSFVIFIEKTQSHLSELLLEEDNNNNNNAPSALGNNHLPMPTLTFDDNTCHVEFTVIKKAIGHCVKIGKVMKACISGSYIHPLHPDCM
jgi:hypothetical protein